MIVDKEGNIVDNELLNIERATAIHAICEGMSSVLEMAGKEAVVSMLAKRGMKIDPLSKVMIKAAAAYLLTDAESTKNFAENTKNSLKWIAEEF